MTFSAPKAPSGDVSKYPVYSGYIRITGENGLVYNRKPVSRRRLAKSLS